jgi:hypothetical protein
MGNTKAGQLTREDVLVIIENYREQGRDTTELEAFLQNAFPGTSKSETPSVDHMVAELREKSPVTQGSCSICGADGSLLSGVCESCFLSWATKTAEDNIARVRKSKQREKL